MESGVRYMMGGIGLGERDKMKASLSVQPLGDDRRTLGDLPAECRWGAWRALVLMLPASALKAATFVALRQAQAEERGAHPDAMRTRHEMAQRAQHAGHPWATFFNIALGICC